MATQLTIVGGGLGGLVSAIAAREAGLETARIRRLTYHRQQRLPHTDPGPQDVG